MTSAANSMSELLARHASERPHAEALSDRETRISWSGLAEGVEHIAAALLALGVGKGDRVAVLAQPQADIFALFHAACSLGAIWTGLNPRHSQPELLRTVLDAQPAVLIARRRMDGRDHDADIRAIAAALPAIAIVVLDDLAGVERALSWRNFLDSGLSLSPTALRRKRGAVMASDPCLLVYTSGSTGNPKGALISGAALAACADVQRRTLDVAEVRILNNLPISHVGAMGDVAAYALSSGGAMVCVERFDPAGLGRLLVEERVTVWGQVPTMFQMALDHPSFPKRRLPDLKLILWSGAPCHVPLARRLARICPDLANMYGTTETVGSVTFAKGGVRDLDRLCHSVGTPAGGHQVRIAELDGNADAARVGEIQVKGQCQMSGYWRRPDATAAVFTEDGWLRTGDLGRLSAEGHLQLSGRLGAAYRSGGYFVSPSEVETVIAGHPSISSVAVVAVPDDVFGEVGRAFVTLKPGRTVDPEDLKRHCRGGLANYKTPKEIRILPELPMLAIGKVDRVRLKTL